MQDTQIIQLYFDRSEDAISRTAEKYEAYCHTIANNILQNSQDSEECVNDTWWKAWDAIPPSRPRHLAAFLGRITRNLSLDCYRRRTAQMRLGGEMAIALEELGECVANGEHPDSRDDALVLSDVLNRFLAALPGEQRRIFLRRYWYISSIREIARDYGLTESKVKMSLLRSREQLKKILEKEGIAL